MRVAGRRGCGVPDGPVSGRTAAGRRSRRPFEGAAVHRYIIRVRYADTDQMGFAYYGNYLRWFEIGRAEMMRSLGRSYRDIESQGIWLPVLEARCRYLSPARYDDEVAIETGVLELNRASVRFGYRIRRADADELLA